MKKGDVVRAKRQLSIREMNGFQMLGLIEGPVLKKNPLIVEVNMGGNRFQIRMADEVKDLFEVIKEAEEE